MKEKQEAEKKENEELNLKIFPAMKIGTRARRVEGIETMLEELGIIESKFDPESILYKGGERFLNII